MAGDKILSTCRSDLSGCEPSGERDRRKRDGDSYSDLNYVHDQKETASSDRAFVVYCHSPPGYRNNRTCRGEALLDAAVRRLSVSRAELGAGAGAGRLVGRLS